MELSSGRCVRQSAGGIYFGAAARDVQEAQPPGAAEGTDQHRPYLCLSRPAREGDGFLREGECDDTTPTQPAAAGGPADRNRCATRAESQGGIRAEGNCAGNRSKTAGGS